MPMCRLCESFVLVAMWLREKNIIACSEMADELDNKYGIDTREGPGFSDWRIPSPNKSPERTGKTGYIP